MKPFFYHIILPLAVLVFLWLIGKKPSATLDPPQAATVVGIETGRDNE